MMDILRKIFPEDSFIRLTYHKVSAMLANIYYGFPSYRMTVIGVTGTSGKSTTVDIIHHLIESSGIKAGSISGVHIQIGEKKIPNDSLRTTLNPWKTQKILKEMIKAKCQYCVLEISSHAITQNRLWGIPIDTALLTNIHDNEHLDYHKTFQNYVREKAKLFKNINTSYRKPNTKKIIVLNKDDPHKENFENFSADRRWFYSQKSPAEVQALSLNLSGHSSIIEIKTVNNILSITTKLIGAYNVNNILAAIACCIANGIAPQKIKQGMESFLGVPGRLQPINEGQSFSVIVDFSYKPSSLDAVLKSLKKIVKGRVICIWGGAGGRTRKNHQESAKIIQTLADEFILTTDDPYNENPQKLNDEIIPKEVSEGNNFFLIEDRYEAIRYGIFTAQKDDCVLISGRGTEKVQTFGKQKIEFDDAHVAKEILKFIHKQKFKD